jgi:hypothetical protein
LSRRKICPKSAEQSNNPQLRTVAQSPKKSARACRSRQLSNGQTVPADFDKSAHCQQNKYNTTKRNCPLCGQKKGGLFVASPQGKKKKYKSAPTRDCPPSPPTN